MKVGDTAEVRLVSGQTREGKIRYVSKSAVQATRTYRVEVQMPNADNAIPDGITAEVTIPLTPLPAARRHPQTTRCFRATGSMSIRRR